LIIGEIFCDLPVSLRVACEGWYDITRPADSAGRAESADLEFLYLYFGISQSRPIRRLNSGDQAGFNIGLDFHKFLSFSKLLFEM